MSRKQRRVPLVGDLQHSKEELDELLVFGYQCKLFRDDERAEYVNSGGNLIPWMGNTDLMIDRFDGQGHLFDLSEYDAEKVAKQGPSRLSDREEAIEKLCEEERYLELRTDIAEKEMYEEEELKRLNEGISSGYGAVGFSYDEGSNGKDTSDIQEATPVVEEEDGYVMRENLNVPDDIMLPDTEKIHAIIEKTAMFVSSQGTQMEIVIKTKQKNNPQFNFLNFGDDLNLYYRHLVKMIKSGKYKPSSAPPARERKKSEGDSYLHPSLKPAKPQVTPEEESKNFLTSVQSKLPAGQIHDTPYARLVSQMAKHSERNSPEPTNILSAMNTSAPAHHEYPDYAQESLEQPPLYIDQGGGDANFGPQMPPPPGMEPVTLPQGQPILPEPLPAITTSTPIGPPNSIFPPNRPPSIQLPAIQTRFSEFEYNGSSANSIPNVPDRPTHVGEDLGPNISIPPPELRPMIDKMAAYVAKNGSDFEFVVKSKEDKRFDFLHHWHIFHTYYLHKKDEAEKGIVVGSQDKVVSLQRGPCDNDSDEEAHQAQQPKAVSFSVKKKPAKKSKLEKKGTSLFLGESSDEEGEKTSELTEEQQKIINMTGGSTLLNLDYTIAPINITAPPVAPLPGPIKSVPSVPDSTPLSAEEKLKNKLANAGREKLAQASKTERTQAERKRRAAMFLTMLKSGGNPTDIKNDLMETVNGAIETEPVKLVVEGPSLPPAGLPSSAPGSRAGTPPVAPTLGMHMSASTSALSRLAHPSGPSLPSSSSSVSLSSRIDYSNSHHSSKSSRRSRSRSRTRNRYSPYRSKHRSRSPRSRRRRSITPPSAYTYGRRSRSPRRRRSRSSSVPRHYRGDVKSSRKRHRSRSKSRHRSSKKSSRSKSSSSKSKKTHRSPHKRKSKRSKKSKTSKKSKSSSHRRKSSKVRPRDRKENEEKKDEEIEASKDTGNGKLSAEPTTTTELANKSASKNGSLTINKTQDETIVLSSSDSSSDSDADSSSSTSGSDLSDSEDNSDDHRASSSQKSLRKKKTEQR